MKNDVIQYMVDLSTLLNLWMLRLANLSVQKFRDSELENRHHLHFCAFYLDGLQHVSFF